MLSLRLKGECGMKMSSAVVSPDLLRVHDESVAVALTGVCCPMTCHSPVVFISCIEPWLCRAAGAP